MRGPYMYIDMHTMSCKHDGNLCAHVALGKLQSVCSQIMIIHEVVQCVRRTVKHLDTKSRIFMSRYIVCKIPSPCIGERILRYCILSKAIVLSYSSIP